MSDLEPKEDFFKDLEQQMEGVRGGDGFTDLERRGLNDGVSVTDSKAFEAMARMTAEMQSEHNPHNLPLIFRRGKVISVKRSNGKVENDWEVKDFQRAGIVNVYKPDRFDPSRILEKTITFTEFYRLNPPDESCVNAESLEKYKNSLEKN